MALVSAEDIVAQFRHGRMCILAESDRPEAKGWLIMPAQMATPIAINFMATHGRGLVELGLSRDRVRQLGLSALPRSNLGSRNTIELVSIEAKQGVTTGISAQDRARTITTAIDGNMGPDDIVSPGHVFPLQSCDGGVLENPEPVEAAVDFARLAGLNASAVLCAIMRSDGETATFADLEALAFEHDLKLVTIGELASYRQLHDRLIERGETSAFMSLWGGEWRAVTYLHAKSGERFLALTHGDNTGSDAVPVLLHPISLLGDVFGKVDERAGLIKSAMRLMSDRRAGVIIVMRPGSGSDGNPTNSLLRMVSHGEIETEYPAANFSVAAQILHEMGIEKIELISSAQSRDALAKLGVVITNHLALSQIAAPDADGPVLRDRQTAMRTAHVFGGQE
jgi:3,4-dihydroxy 2-butanone 4-phosphate synthase/GTP cyclohydrolase II